VRRKHVLDGQFEQRPEALNYRLSHTRLAAPPRVNLEAAPEVDERHRK
jgi:hypothetical protein